MSMENYGAVEREEPNELLFLNCVNFVLFVTSAIVTVGIGQFGLFGFPTTQEISESYPTLVTAASWAPTTIVFALIVSQLTWATAQLFPEFRLKSRDGVKHYYVGVALCQFVWVMMFTYRLVLISLFAALAIAWFLGLILYDQSKQSPLATLRDYWTLKFPFVLYFGWVIYVILWNLSVVLVDSDVSANVQYWIALASLMIMGMASFGTVLCTQAEYPISVLMAYVTVSMNISCFVVPFCIPHVAILALDWHLDSVDQS